MITLTRELIESLRTPAGGFNRATIDALGTGWPLVSGWIDRAIGTEVSDRAWRSAQKARTEQRHFYRGNTRRKP